MSKKKLLEFGLKEADAFQKNFKIIFDRLVRGYRSMMGKDPEGLDLLKVKMEAREKALETTKVVNQKGLTLDPDKPIMGGTQEGIPTIKTKFDEELTVGVDTIKDQMDKIKSTSSKLDEVMKEREAMFKPKSDTDEFNLSKDDPMGDLEKILKGEGDTGLPKGPRPFGDNIRDAYREAGRSREDATEMIKALDSPGAKKSYEIMEEALGVRLYGDETFEELMQIKETGVHPRGEPPLKKSEGGRVAFRGGGMDASQDDFGGTGNTASDTGPGGGATDRGPSFTGDSIGSGGGMEEIFVATAPQVNPNLAKKGPNIISAPNIDPRFSGYVPSTFDPGGQNIFQKGFNLIKKTVTNPFVKNVGFGLLGGPIGAKLGLSRQIDLFNKARAVKSLFDQFGPMADQTIEDVLEEETGQTTALYKDGGLVTLFREKR